jgi:hypothetical protein
MTGIRSLARNIMSSSPKPAETRKVLEGIFGTSIEAQNAHLKRKST